MLEVEYDFDKVYDIGWTTWKHTELGFTLVRRTKKNDNYKPYTEEYKQSLGIDYTRPIIKIKWTGKFTWLFGYPDLAPDEPEGKFFSTIYPTKFKTIYALVEDKAGRKGKEEIKYQMIFISKEKFSMYRLKDLLKTFDRMNASPDPNIRPTLVST